MILNKEHLNRFLDAGSHYGHKSWKRNPKMNKYIHGKLNGIDIIDLRQTLLMFDQALQYLKEALQNKGKALFICTKVLHRELISNMCEKYKQYYVNYKWLGGLLTNWNTSLISIKKMYQFKEIIQNQKKYNYTKKELCKIEKELNKKELLFAGCAKMNIDEVKVAVVFDTIHNINAIRELRKLNIPIIGIVDTNADPDNVDVIIPGNDDSSKAISLYVDLFEQLLSNIYSNEKIKDKNLDESLREEFTKEL